MHLMTAEPYAFVVLAVVFLSALTRSTFGFGDALLAMPILTMVVGIEVAAPLVAMISITIAAMILLQDWHRVDLKSAGWLVAFSFVGIPAGFLFLKEVQERFVTSLLAVVIIGFSSYALLRPRLFVLKSDNFACLF